LRCNNSSSFASEKEACRSRLCGQVVKHRMHPSDCGTVPQWEGEDRFSRCWSYVSGRPKREVTKWAVSQVPKEAARKRRRWVVGSNVHETFHAFSDAASLNDVTRVGRKLRGTLHPSAKPKISVLSQLSGGAEGPSVGMSPTNRNAPKRTDGHNRPSDSFWRSDCFIRNRHQSDSIDSCALSCGCDSVGSAN